MSEESKKTPTKIEVVDGRDQAVAYSNIVKVYVSSDEVVVHFGQRRMGTSRDGDADKVADGVAKVYMSFNAFKRFASIATNLIEVQESRDAEAIISAEDIKTLQAKGIGVEINR